MPYSQELMEPGEMLNCTQKPLLKMLKRPHARDQSPRLCHSCPRRMKNLSQGVFSLGADASSYCSALLKLGNIYAC